MKIINNDFDKLKDIILIYANTPPTPAENLRIIEEQLLDISFNDPIGYNGPSEMYDDPNRANIKIWEDILSQTELHYRIRFTMWLQQVGRKDAAITMNQMRQIDDAIPKDTFERYSVDMPPRHIEGEVKAFFNHLLENIEKDVCPGASREQIRIILYDGLFDVYGICADEQYERRCPCNFAKMNMLASHGMVAANEDLDKSTWIKTPLNCLECNHLHFNTILDDIANGSFNLLYESQIVTKYQKTYIETVESGGGHCLQKATAYEFLENDAAFPRFLSGMPCNILVDFLTSKEDAYKKIKRCPICKKIFFAKDAKREKCYDPSCFKEYKRKSKMVQRENDIVKYKSF